MVEPQDPEAIRLPLDDAWGFAARALEAAGASPEDAALTARSLLLAERAGHAGHGLARLPGYAGRLRAGGTVSRRWRATRRSGPVEAYDGRAGLGHVHLWRATDRAADLATEHGLGIVGVARSNHCGALGAQARRLAERHLVSLLATNAPAVLAPPGGHAPVAGSNAVCLGAPVPDGPPLVCDLSSAQVNRGEIMRAAQEGQPIPQGWAFDAEGRPTTDAAVALVGTLQPLGGAKGFALALGLEVLTGVLLGPAVGPQVRDFFGDGLDEPQDVAHLVIALDPTTFGLREAFDARIAALRTAVESAGPPGATRLPGARAAAHAAALGDGVILDAGLRRALAALAHELGIEPPCAASSGRP